MHALASNSSLPIHFGTHESGLRCLNDSVPVGSLLLVCTMLSGGVPDMRSSEVAETLLCISAIVQLDSARHTVPVHSSSLLAASIACARFASTGGAPRLSIALLHTLSMLSGTLALLAWDTQLDTVSSFVFFSYFVHVCDCVWLALQVRA